MNKLPPNNTKKVIVISLIVSFVLFAISLLSHQLGKEDNSYTIEKLNKDPVHLLQITMGSIDRVYDTGRVNEYGKQVVVLGIDGYYVLAHLWESEVRKVSSGARPALSFNSYLIPLDGLNSQDKTFDFMQESLSKYNPASGFRDRIVATYFLSTSGSDDASTLIISLFVAMLSVLFVIPLVYNLLNYSVIDFSKIRRRVVFNSMHENKRPNKWLAVLIGVLGFATGIGLMFVIEGPLDMSLASPLGYFAFWIFVINFVITLFFEDFFISIDDSKITFNKNGAIIERPRSEIEKMYLKTWIVPVKRGGIKARLLVIVFNDGTKMTSEIKDKDYQALAESLA